MTGTFRMHLPAVDKQRRIETGPSLLMQIFISGCIPERDRRVKQDQQRVDFKFTQLMLVAVLGYQNQSDWSSKIDKDGYLKQAADDVQGAIYKDLPSSMVFNVLNSVYRLTFRNIGFTLKT